MNIVMLSGHVGRDPVIRTFPNGDRVAQFSLATSKVYRDRTSNELVDKTEWHRIRVYGPATGGLVDRVQRMVSKGSHLNIVGELTSTPIVTNQGEKFPISYVDVRRAEGLEILDKKRDREARAAASQATAGATAPAGTTTPASVQTEVAVQAVTAAPATAPAGNKTYIIDDFDDELDHWHSFPPTFLTKHDS